MPELNVLLFLTLALAGFMTAYLYYDDEYTIDGQDPAELPRDFQSGVVRNLPRRPTTVDQPVMRGFAAAFFDVTEIQDQRSYGSNGLELDFITGIHAGSSVETEGSHDCCA